jgi:hypothetical protein
MFELLNLALNKKTLYLHRAFSRGDRGWIFLSFHCMTWLLYKLSAGQRSVIPGARRLSLVAGAFACSRL